MAEPLVLASASSTRHTLLRNAGVPFTAQPVSVDEAQMRDALQAEGAPPRDIADALAEMKARKAASRFPQALVLGCDQLLSIDGEILAKPSTRAEAAAQLRRLRGTTHQLLSAAVIYADAAPVWRHVGVVRLTMKAFSDSFLDAYLDRNWPGLSDTVGAYKLEEEGVRLFSQVNGDYFCVLGLPLLELIGYLGTRGVIET
jgi:septum formation protein